MSIVDKINFVALPDTQYVKEETTKTAIYIHHTAGSPDPDDVVSYWAGTEERVATHFIIGGAPAKASTPSEDGKLVQAYNTKYWGYHLGLKANKLPAGSKSTTYLNSRSVGIELCNWGQLTKLPNGTFQHYARGIVPTEQVVDLGYKYRGYQYWHAYTDKQIQTLRELLVFLCAKFTIPKGYKGNQMFELDLRAFKGEPGIWTHGSVRSDKVDCSPQPKLIEMLKTL